ncbi:unnamed protein product [marine sediment metagenome]|uniref:Uncharacterized protein n=1 Tax=marine sediment metagenome TaxID=412755 RepID=X1SMY4_9ZZZZ
MAGKPEGFSAGTKAKKGVNMATDLEELIQYWKDRLVQHPPITSRDWKETVQTTIAYLERLNELWKEKQNDELNE